MDIPCFKLMAKPVRRGIAALLYLGIRKRNDLEQGPLGLRVYNHLAPSSAPRGWHTGVPIMPGKENIRCMDIPVISDETVPVFLVPSRPFSIPAHVVHLRKVTTVFGDPYLITYMRRALHRYPMAYLVDSRPYIIILNPNLANMGLGRHLVSVQANEVFGSTRRLNTRVWLRLKKTYIASEGATYSA